MPEKPSQEIVVALAGPAVTLVIALVLMFLLGARFDLSQMAQLEQAQTSLIGRIAAANVVLLLFNLIPAFPMDGGRVLRAVLAIGMGYTRATRVAASIGQGLAVVFAFLGLMGNPLLVLVAVFIFLAASGEAGYVQARDYTRGYLASHAMITAYQSLSPTSTADDAAALLLRTTQQEFPVVDGAGKLRGVVTREALIAALQEKGGGRAGARLHGARRADGAGERVPRQCVRATAAPGPAHRRRRRSAAAPARLHHGGEPCRAGDDPVFPLRPHRARRARLMAGMP